MRLNIKINKLTGRASVAQDENRTTFEWSGETASGPFGFINLRPGLDIVVGVRPAQAYPKLKFELGSGLLELAFHLSGTRRYNINFTHVRKREAIARAGQCAITYLPFCHGEIENPGDHDHVCLNVFITRPCLRAYFADNAGDIPGVLANFVNHRGSGGAPILEQFQSTASVGYYYYKIDDYIMFNRDPYPLLFAGRIEDAVFNADYLVVQGLEAEVRFSLLDRLNGYLNYTYQNSELGSTRVAEDQLYDDHYQLPRHKANLGLDYAVLENTILLANLRHVDKRKTSLDQEIDAYTTMDLALEQRFFNQQAHVKVYVTNLFDAGYEERYKVPAPDRVFGVNLGFTF